MTRCEVLLKIAVPFFHIIANILFIRTWKEQISVVNITSRKITHSYFKYSKHILHKNRVLTKFKYVTIFAVRRLRTGYNSILTTSIWFSYYRDASLSIISSRNLTSDIAKVSVHCIRVFDAEFKYVFNHLCCASSLSNTTYASMLTV